MTTRLGLIQILLIGIGVTSAIFLIAGVIIMNNKEDRRVKAYHCNVDSAIMEGQISQSLYIIPKAKSITIEYKKDTIIHQDISYEENTGQYVLQTWVSTSKEQLPQCFKHRNATVERMYDSNNYYNGTYSYPKSEYCNEIVGSYQYIKDNKMHEYNRAHIFYLAIIKKGQLDSYNHIMKSNAAKKAEDSVKALDSIPVNSIQHGK